MYPYRTSALDGEGNQQKEDKCGHRRTFYQLRVPHLFVFMQRKASEASLQYGERY